MQWTAVIWETMAWDSFLPIPLTAHMILLSLHALWKSSRWILSLSTGHLVFFVFIAQSAAGYQIEIVVCTAFRARLIMVQGHLPRLESFSTIEAFLTVP
jgi:hypothetical protein